MNLFLGKKLQIFKYNKSLHNKLDLTINDFKEFSEKVEIEIIPIEGGFDKFINIPEKDERYYHIYFNDSYEEIKGEYFLNLQNENVKRIRIIIDIQVTSFNELFKS